jgi:hypothetical protein
MQRSTTAPHLSTPFARIPSELFSLPLSHAAFRVLCAIMLHHYDNDACKDIELLQATARVKKTSVYDALAELKQLGVLEEIDGRLFVEKEFMRDVLS